MKKTVSAILSAAIAFTALFCVACDNAADANKFDIVERDPLPVIEPYKDFDMTTAFIVQEGATYSYEGYYVNSKGIEKDLVFNGSVTKISADNASFANVTVRATKGEETVEKEISLTVEGVSDVIDEGINKSYKDPGISKSINFNPNYVKDGNSSVKVDFSGYINVWGSQFSSILGHLNTIDGGIYDTDYFSIYKKADQESAWEDAVMTFWIYYASAPRGYEDEKLSISYFLRWNDFEDIPLGMNRFSDWGSSPITQCEVGEWTQVAIRFKDFGKRTPLLLDFDRYKNGYNAETQFEMMDIVSYKCRVGDEGFDGINYSYSFFFDSLDVMTYADFVNAYPDYEFADLNQPKEILPQSDVRHIDLNEDIENFASSGKALVFDFRAIDNAANTGDTVEFTLWGRNWGNPRRTDLVAVNVVENVVTYNGETIGKVEALEDGWYRVTISLSDLPINTDEGATGEETVGMIFFNFVSHAFEIFNIGFVEADS